MHVAHLPVHEQDFTLLAAVIKPRLALGQRCTGHIKRAFDRAGRAALDTGFALRLVHAQVEEGFDAETRHQQCGFVRLAECGDIAHRGPEFIRLNVEIFDGAEQVGYQPMQDALHPRVAGVIGDTADLGEKVLHVLGVQQGFTHFTSSMIYVSLANIPARDGKRYAGDVGSLVGGQEQDRRGLFLGGAVSLHQTG